MPTYEYLCLNCDAEFEKVLPISQADKRVRCPQCGARRTKKLLSSFYAAGLSSKRSSSSACATCTRSSCSSCKP